MNKFNPERENPCWGCEYRKNDEMDWTNICLLDEKLECVCEKGINEATVDKNHKEE